MAAVLNPGRYLTWVTADDPKVDGTTPTYEPSRIKCSLRSTGISTETGVEWAVETRYHSQITFNTRLTLDDGRQLFVRSIGNYGNVDRSNVLTLTCEEVLTP